ncbi:MAG: ABC transporter permease [Saprospiraceae bacterium]|nr:ABC transporter permease [Saprospiraceae bacterium]
MFQNYLKIALRNLLKQKGLTAINVLGLSIGLACFSLFMLYAVNEFSYDRFHDKGDRTFRVLRWWEAGFAGRDEAGGDSYLPMPLGPALKTDFPDVEQFVRLREAWGENFVRANGEVSRAGVQFADPSFFEVFSFKIKYGSPSAALKDRYNVVLTEKMAQRLFGESNPTGKTLEIKLEDKFEPYTVAAVAENPPPNSTIQFDILGNFERLYTTKFGEGSLNNWNRSSLQTYVLLRPGSGLADNSKQLLGFYQKYYPDQKAALQKEGSWKGEGAPCSFRLQPLREMHAGMETWGENAAEVDPTGIWTLLAIAAGVLLIACINFTTLSIGRSAGRAKEVGVRKVIGGGRGQLVRQFLTESLLLSALSAVIGLAMAQALMPAFNEMADRTLSFSLRLYPEIGWLAVGLTLLVGLLAGSYPALVLSGFKPVEILKSKVRLGGANFFTKSLVTTQFVLSIGLAAATLIIVQQLHFMRSQNPGFQRENVVVVDASDTDSEKIYPRFRQLALQQPQVMGVASAELGLGEGTGWSQSGWAYQGKQKNVYEYFVDNHYMDVLGMQLLAGRNFDPKFATDTINSIIVNEAFLKDFGWTAETALGQKLEGYYEGSEKPLPVVVGVVKDFNFRPFKEEVKPQLFHQFSDYAPFKFFVRLQPGDPAPALAALKLAWASAESELPFKYSFLDENLDRFYESEARFSNIIGWAGGISIFLACLGLFGLAALAAANRTKEIGIRKVLGASLGGIVGLLSKDFLRLVALAILIAAPLAWYFMQKWLDDFAYRIELHWWQFLAAGAGAVAVAFLTVSFQSVKAALANPVESLRSE